MLGRKTDRDGDKVGMGVLLDVRELHWSDNWSAAFKQKFSCARLIVEVDAGKGAYAAAHELHLSDDWSRH